MYRVVILGGSGFIGRNLAIAFRDRGSSVIAIARHWDELIPGVECVHGNAYDFELLGEVLKPGDIVYHLVSATIPSTSNNNFLYDCEQNLVNTVKLLDVLAGLQISRLIFTSSGGAVYGVPNRVPIAESAETFPVSAYGVSKLSIEKYLHLYSRLKSLSVSILRIANPYGPGQEKQKGQGVIGTFIRKGLIGQCVEIWGDGSTIRDYIYIDDLVDVMVKAGRINDKFLLLNIGSGEGFSLLELIDRINDHLDIDLDVIYRPQRECDVPAVVLDISKACGKLEWVPKTTLESGIKKTVDAMKGCKTY